MLALPIAMGACALPAAGPTQLELASSSTNGDFPYTTVDISARVIANLNRFQPTFGPHFSKGGSYSATNAMRPGNVVALTVYESGGSSLFPPPSVVSGTAASSPLGTVSTGASNIPPQMIEADGTIFVPFVGRLKVSGMTPAEAGELIQRELQGKAVSPQVLVSLVNNIGNSATVGGEVMAAKPVPLSSRGERLLDVIAAAGGAKYPAYETYVRVVRDGQVGNVLLQTIVNNPKENIIIRPRDQVYLTRNPRTFAVLGAALRVSNYPFANEKVTLAEALAQAGGPTDVIGDSSGVYIFRFEPWFLAKDLLDPAYAASLAANPPEFVPILYHINMRSADGYFLAQAFQMRDKDVVLVTNAVATQLQKLVNLVRGSSGIAFDIRRIDTLQ